MPPEHSEGPGRGIVPTRSTAAPTSTAWASCSTRPSPASGPSPRRGGAGRSSTCSMRAADDRLRPLPRLRDRHPEIPAALEAVIRRCLEPEPARPLPAAATGGRPPGRRRRPAASLHARALAQPRGRLASPPAPPDRGGGDDSARDLRLCSPEDSACAWNRSTCCGRPATSSSMGEDALDRGDFSAAKAHFDTAVEPRDAVDGDALELPAQDEGYRPNRRAIEIEDRRSQGRPSKPEELIGQALEKSQVAERTENKQTGSRRAFRGGR